MVSTLIELRALMHADKSAFSDRLKAMGYQTLGQRLRYEQTLRSMEDADDDMQGASSISHSADGEQGPRPMEDADGGMQEASHISHSADGEQGLRFMEGANEQSLGAINIAAVSAATATTRTLLVTLCYGRNDTERRMVTRVSSPWQRQPVQRLVAHFAQTKLIGLNNIDEECLQLQSSDGVLIDNSSISGDALVDGAEYAVVAVTQHDALANGNPFYLPLDREEVRRAIRMRDPRSHMRLETEPPPRFDVADDAAYAYLEEHGYCVIKALLITFPSHCPLLITFHFLSTFHFPLSTFFFLLLPAFDCPYPLHRRCVVQGTQRGRGRGRDFSLVGLY